MAKTRINKALADAGVASRRKAEELVSAGRVEVNGRVVTDLSTKVDPRVDRIRVDGKPVKKTIDVYFIYHKPRGVVSTMTDERGRECVGDICRKLPGNPRIVGRLDRSSEGLMFLTSDGELANRLVHPRYQVNREYLVTVSPQLLEADAQKLVTGVDLEDGSGVFVGMVLQEDVRDASRIRVVINEGRNRFIRRMFETLGYGVKRLKRLRMGPMSLGSLKLGETRPLSGGELENLRNSVLKSK